MERFVERFRYKATKAKQAQSRVKKLAKIERIERDPRDGQALEFRFKAPERTGRVIFELQDGRVEIGGRRRRPIVLLDGAELWLERGEHVTLVGPNGTGKTTLIETLAGRRALAAGKLSTGHNVQVGYLSQHADELGAGGDPNQSVLEATQHATGLTPNKARALLGRFLFSGEEAEKPLAGLSGGERRRLSLAILVQSGANVLILDEPTNHLDIESREALEDALRAFPGAVLLVSHDRALLDAVGTRTVAVEDATLRSYEGGWAEYARVREEEQAQSGAGESPHAATPASAACGARLGRRMRRPTEGRMRPSEQQTERRRASPSARPSRRAPPRTVSTPSRRPRRPSKPPRRPRRRSNRSSPTPPPGPRATRRPSPRPGTPPPSARSTPPTRSSRRLVD